MQISSEYLTNLFGQLATELDRLSGAAPASILVHPAGAEPQPTQVHLPRESGDCSSHSQIARATLHPLGGLREFAK